MNERPAGIETRRLVGVLRTIGIDRAAVVLGVAGTNTAVAQRVAVELSAPYDVLIVRRLFDPCRPDVTIGAIGEGGVRTINDFVAEAVGLTGTMLVAIEREGRAHVNQLLACHEIVHERQDLAGRTVVVVDSVSNLERVWVACTIAHRKGATRVVLALPFVPPGWSAALVGAADDIATPCGVARVRATPGTVRQNGSSSIRKNGSGSGLADANVGLAGGGHVPAATDAW